MTTTSSTLTKSRLMVLRPILVLTVCLSLIPIYHVLVVSSTHPMTNDFPFQPGPSVIISRSDAAGPGRSPSTQNTKKNDDDKLSSASVPNDWTQLLLAAKSIQEKQQPIVHSITRNHNNDLRNSALSSTSVVAIQFLNQGYIEITKNWICNVHHVNNAAILERTLFVATDEVSYRTLMDWDKSLHVVHVHYESSSNNNKNNNDEKDDHAHYLKYGQYDYFAFMLFRTRLIIYLLLNDVTLWLIESDAFWIQDPTHEVVLSAILNTTSNSSSSSSNNIADMVVMSDVRPPKKSLQGGFQLLRPTRAAIGVWQELYNQFFTTLETYRLQQEQPQNATSSPENAPTMPDDTSTTKLQKQKKNQLGNKGSEQLMMDKLIQKHQNDKTLTVVWLDPRDFYSGLYYHNARYAKSAIGNKDIKIILNNWIKGNDAKIARAKEWGYWFLDDTNTTTNSSGECNDKAVTKAIQTILPTT